MDQDTRNKLQRATQQVRRILEEEFTEQLEGTFDVLPDGKILPEPGKHLDARQRLTRRKLVDAVEHIKAGGKTSQEAVDEYTREAAFTFLNRFVALRMLEARGMLQECVSKGDASSGFKEFCGLAPGLSSLDDGGYRLYLECLFDELTVEVKVLFDRRDSASVLWPRRGALTELLDILSDVDLSVVWSEDETIGWVYQYFNSAEERKKMREESQAPRNSRELAVRNQFFTPRYVVEFLTDNTLGRIWYEMRKGQTRLADECRHLVRRPSEVFLSEGQEPPAEHDGSDQDLKQEELLKKAVYIPHRAKQDPRDLKILDPACGSGHFLLYAFDLLISIYEEAWHDETPPTSEVSGRRLRDDFTKLEQLQAALPGLVLAHNLHGIDIDPRAAQIAALALWMRGQRAFSDFQISRERRPLIQKSNIVCAEPMPGEGAFLDEFIAEHLEDDAAGRFLANLVRKVFEAMKLAGEAGSLLRIEEDIAEEVKRAKKLWQERPEYKQQSLFDDGPRTVQRELDLTRGITDESFWGEAEHLIYNALNTYSEQTDRSSGFQRCLFAADAARGFAFIDLCRKRYDVALMNPPFGNAPDKTQSLLKSKYRASWTELAASFVSRGRMLARDGFLGAITTRGVLSLKGLGKWRLEHLVPEAGLIVDLGQGVMDNALVEATAYVCGESFSNSSMLTLDVSEQESKDIDANVWIGACPLSRQLVERIPENRILFNVPFEVLQLITRAHVTFEPSIGTARPGFVLFDSFRFLRLAYEVDPSTIGQSADWVWYSKGGTFRRHYTPIHIVTLRRDNGAEMRAVNLQKHGQTAQAMQGSTYYFRPGGTYTRRSQKGFSARNLPAGCITSFLSAHLRFNFRELNSTGFRLPSTTGRPQERRNMTGTRNA